MEHSHEQENLPGIELGLVGLAQLFRGGDGPSRGWGGNRFLLRGCLGWKNWETGGSHAAGTWNRCLAPSACAAATFGENELGREWGRGSLPEARRVLEPPSPAHSHRLGASRCPRLLGPRGQPRLCSASLYPPGMAPAGPTSVIPAGGTSPAPSLSGGMVAASSNPRSCGGGCGVCDLVGAAPCPGCRGGHGEGSR